MCVGGPRDGEPCPHHWRGIDRYYVSTHVGAGISTWAGVYTYLPGAGVYEWQPVEVPQEIGD